MPSGGSCHRVVLLSAVLPSSACHSGSAQRNPEKRGAESASRNGHPKIGARKSGLRPRKDGTGAPCISLRQRAVYHATMPSKEARRIAKRARKFAWRPTL